MGRNDGFLFIRKVYYPTEMLYVIGDELVGLISKMNGMKTFRKKKCCGSALITI